MLSKACNILDRLHNPASLVLQIMNRKDGTYSLIKFVFLVFVFQIYRNQAGLPVMAMQNIRFKIDNRQRFKNCFRKISKFLYIFINVVIRLVPCKIIFIINKIVSDSLHFCFKYAYILTPPAESDIKAGVKTHLRFPFLLHADIFRQNNAYIIF